MRNHGRSVISQDGDPIPFLKSRGITASTFDGFDRIVVGTEIPGMHNMADLRTKRRRVEAVARF